jgi:hypothetical protein
MSREVLKVFCSGRHNHGIGTVIADTEGYAVKYIANAVHKGSVFPSSQKVTDRLNRDEVGSLAAYCRSCNRPVTLSVRALLRAVDDGKRQYHAPFTDSVNEPWGGRMVTDPDGAERLKHDPRGTER